MYMDSTHVRPGQYFHICSGRPVVHVMFESSALVKGSKQYNHQCWPANLTHLYHRPHSHTNHGLRFNQSHSLYALNLNNIDNSFTSKIDYLLYKRNQISGC